MTDSPRDPLLDAEVATLDALLAARDWEAAGSRLPGARERWPRELRLKLREAAWLEGVGRPEEAERRLLESVAEHPGKPWPPVRLVELALRTGKVDLARRVFSESAWRADAPEPTRRRLLTSLAATLADPAERRAWLEGLLSGKPDDRFVYAKLAAAAFREADRGRCEAMLAAATALGPLPDEALPFALDLHLAAARFDEAHAIAAALEAANPDRAEHARRAIESAFASQRFAEGIERLERALGRWPADWLLLHHYNRCPLPRAADVALFELATRQAPAMLGDDRWSFQYALACLRHGRPAEAADRVGRVASGGPVWGMAAPLRAALASQSSEVWSNPRRVSNFCDDDLQVVPVPGARATVLVFASVVGGLGYLPFGLADGLLRQRPVNVVYVRDRHHRGFTRGVASLGPDHAAMVAGLGRLTGSLGVPAIALGSSLAGVAAIRAATRMGAPAAISFAGPVDLDGEGPPSTPTPTARSPVFAALTRGEPKVVDAIRAAPGTTVHHCFGTGFAPDVAAAGLLVDLANVRLHPVPECADHFVIEHVIASGVFFSVLDAAIEAALTASASPVRGG